MKRVSLLLVGILSISLGAFAADLDANVVIKFGSPVLQRESFSLRGLDLNATLLIKQGTSVDLNKLMAEFNAAPEKSKLTRFIIRQLILRRVLKEALPLGIVLEKIDVKISSNGISKVGSKVFDALGAPVYDRMSGFDENVGGLISYYCLRGSHPCIDLGWSPSKNIK